MSTPLRIVTTNVAAQPTAQSMAGSPASLADRVLQLQAEARGLAREHIASLEAALHQTEALAEEIARGGDAYPPGIRDIARRLSQDSAAKALMIDAIVGRL
ncbi:MAG TPA: hypothetical protein VF459_03445 [Caulobacteraceae bacterium]